MANTTAKKTVNAANSDALKRRVKIRVESGIGQREPLTVRVNDYTAIIKRGVTVEVPYFVALAIQESQDADMKTNLRIEELASNFEAKSKGA